MKKNHLAKRLAKQSRTSTAAAADRLDRVVGRILKNLRNGEQADLPGLGTFIPGAKPAFHFDRPRGKQNEDQ